MSRARFIDEFKYDAVAQVKEWGYSVAEISDRLGGRTKLLCTWIGQLSRPAKEVSEATRHATAYFAKDAI